MKRLILITLSVLFSISLFAQRSVPDINILNAKGETVSIKTLIPSGKPVVLSFWDTSCKPCIQELGALSDVYDDWSDEIVFEIVAISTDDTRSSSKAVPLAKGKGWPFIVGLDRNGDLKRAMNVQSNPSIFIVDKEGRIVYSHIGYNTGGENKIYEELKKLQ